MGPAEVRARGGGGGRGRDCVSAIKADNEQAGGQCEAREYLGNSVLGC